MADNSRHLNRMVHVPVREDVFLELVRVAREREVSLPALIRGVLRKATNGYQDMDQIASFAEVGARGLGASRRDELLSDGTGTGA